jgi:chitinase
MHGGQAARIESLRFDGVRGGHQLLGRLAALIAVVSVTSLTRLHVQASDVVVMQNETRHKQGDEAGTALVLCYYTNWSQYRPEEGRFVPENIDVTLCTHLIYAFAKIDGGILAPYEWNDDSTPWSKGMYERFNDLKAKKSGLKTLLSVGGWTLGSQPFSQMVATAATRSRFIEHAVQYLRNRTFDGLDVGWEFPTTGGSPPEDRDRFSLLIQELRVAFENEAEKTHRQRLLLTVAVGVGKDIIDSAYDVPAIAKFVDYINLMAYNFHGSWESQTGFNSPLYARSSEKGLAATLNQDWSVRYWIGKGAPANKINLGIASFGNSYHLEDPKQHFIGSPTVGPGQPGEYTRSPGTLAYYEICRRLQQGWARAFDSEQKSNYAYSDDQWVGYDDENSVGIKAAYAKTMKLAGTFVWTLAMDDFVGDFCQRGTYPLLKAMVKGLQ